ncbi:MAG: PilW family protein, partial [Deltaproteobacteria bacterium]|nr:PilW family protein [Deltaproteobacteria bacterium]
TYYLEDNNLRRSTINKDTGDPMPQTIAKDIEALNFVYLDADGSVIADPVTDIDDIASVQIAIVARSERPDPKYSGSQTFLNMQGDTIGTFTDHYRRELLTAQVKCRNIGLE